MPAQRDEQGDTRVVPGWRGRFFEDFRVGDVYQHRLGRTITDTDNIWFTLLTLNTNPVHFDYQFAEQGEFKKPLVNSAFTVSLVSGMSVSDFSENAIANLGWDQIKLTRPVFVGDTLRADSTVLETRESKSRPNAGIVTVRTRGINQDGEVVLSFTRTILVYRHGFSPRTSLFPAEVEE